MGEAQRKGRRAEWLAVWWLRASGHHILGRNVKLPMGEIDIVARRGRVLIFVEVKYRHMPMPIGASVSARQWRRVAAAASAFVARRQGLHELRWRFDQMLFVRRHMPQHRKNVWRM